jgi:DNA-directed RNA polymerase specialized sigma24 family protein
MTPREAIVTVLADDIESLPDELRDVVILHDLLGHLLTKVARRLKTDERAVTGLLLRSYRKLHELQIEPPEVPHEARV